MTGDNRSDPGAHAASNRRHDMLFRFILKCRRGLIQQQKGSTPIECPGKGKPLPLTS